MATKSKQQGAKSKNSAVRKRGGGGQVTQGQIQELMTEIRRVGQKQKASKKPRQRGNRDETTGYVGAGKKTFMSFVGLADLNDHHASYTAGYIYVGNGTNGANNAVLWSNYVGTLVAGNQAQYPTIPILPSDTNFGTAYMANMAKNFFRRRYKRILLHIDSLQPNTTSALVVCVAPVRGANAVNFTTVYPIATAGATGAAVASARAMKGNVYMDSFEMQHEAYHARSHAIHCGRFGPQTE